MQHDLWKMKAERVVNQSAPRVTSNQGMMVNRKLRAGLRTIKIVTGIVSAGDPGGAVRWLTAFLQAHRQSVDLRLYGYPISVRPIIDDVASSLVCFRHEFTALPKIMPGGKDALIVDGGGFIGAAAIFFATHYPDSLIVTVEPDPENFEMLKKNIADFDNITAIHAALAPTEGKAILNDRGTGRYGYTIVQDPADAPAKPIGEVPTTTVSEVISRCGAPSVHIVKLDIEGGERALLTDPHVTRWLSRTKCLCVELHDRIAPGASEAFEQAIVGRRIIALGGEKLVAITDDTAMTRA